MSTSAAAAPPADPLPGDRSNRPKLRDAALVAGAALVVTIPGLGDAPLAFSEAHRAVPGWHMLETGDWTRLQLFGLDYLRKPPGMPLAIAASSAVLGENAFAARLPSAIAFVASAGLAWRFTGHWLRDRRAALAGGVAVALCPLLWTVARAAEIEALHVLTTQAAACPALALTARPRGSTAWRLSHPWLYSAAAIGSAAMVLTKGPAGVPFVLAAIGVGVATSGKDRRIAACARAAIPVLVGAGVGALVTAQYFAPALTGAESQDIEPPVTQGPGDFMWSQGLTWEPFAMPVLAAVAALPLALAALFPVGPDARREARASAHAGSRFRAARVSLLAWLVSLALLLAIGVDNPRYAMPAVVFLAPVVGYAVLAMRHDAAPAFTPKRRAIARWMALGRPAALAAVLLVAAQIFWPTRNAVREARSGEPAGVAIAEAILADTAGDAVLFADDLIEASPEAPWAAARRAAAEHRSITPRWTKRPLAEATEALDGAVAVYIAIRTDEDSRERNELRALIDAGRATRIHAGAIGDRYALEVWRVG